MRSVVGLDLSITCTGVARGDGTLELIRTKSDLDDVVRRRLIAAEVRDVICDDAPVVTVIEGLPTGRAHGIGELGMVHGVVLDLFPSMVPILWIAPNQRAGFATGRHNASKIDVVKAALAAGAPIPDKPKLGAGDRADAFWLRAIGLATFGEWIVDDLPHRRALVERLTGVAA